MRPATKFRYRVLALVRRIPVGRVATYGDVARLAGAPRAWRAVGAVMRTCSEPGVPCHRVIAAGGRLGGYGGNERLKRALLRAEGLTVVNGRVRRFAEVRWTSARAIVRSQPPGETAGSSSRPARRPTRQRARQRH